MAATYRKVSYSARYFILILSVNIRCQHCSSHALLQKKTELNIKIEICVLKQLFVVRKSFFNYAYVTGNSAIWNSPHLFLDYKEQFLQYLNIVYSTGKYFSG